MKIKFLSLLLITTGLMALATACSSKDDEPEGPNKTQQAGTLNTHTDFHGGIHTIEPSYYWNCKIVRVDGKVDDCKLMAQNTYYDTFPVYTGDRIEIDLLKPYKVDQLEFSFYSGLVAILSEVNNVQISTDGKNWDDWGTAKFGPEWYQWYLSFPSQVTFRYFRCTAGGYVVPEWGCLMANIRFLTWSSQPDAI